MRNILFLLSLLILYSCTSNSEIEFRENTKFENLALTRSSIDLTINHPNLLISKKPYNFSVAGVGANLFAYQWNFGKNATLENNTGSSVNVTFNEAGIYPLSLSAFELFDLNGNGKYDLYQLNDKAYNVYQNSPNIIGDKLIGKEDTYEYSMQYSNLSSDFSGEWDIPDGVEYTYLNNNRKVRLKFHTPGKYTIKCRAKEYCPSAENELYISEWSTKEIKVIDYFPKDTWFVNNINIYDEYVDYDIVYSATKDYILTSLYLVLLYNGAYDGTFGGRPLDWINKNNFYLPPKIEVEDGSSNKILDAAYDGGSNIGIKAGTTKILKTHQVITPGKQLQDIEYILFYLYDNTRPNRYREDYDFRE